MLRSKHAHTKNQRSLKFCAVTGQLHRLSTPAKLLFIMPEYNREVSMVHFATRTAATAEPEAPRVNMPLTIKEK